MKKFAPDQLILVVIIGAVVLALFLGRVL